MGIVDRDRKKVQADYPVFYPDDILPEFDVMIVSAYYFMAEISEQYRGKPYKLLSLETLIREAECTLAGFPDD